MELLVKSGLPETKRKCVNISSNGTALVMNLDNTESIALIEAIHGRKFFDKKLYCNGYIPLTPAKTELSTTDQSGKPLPHNNINPSASDQSEKPLPPPSYSLSTSAQVENKDKIEPQKKPFPPSIFAGSSQEQFNTLVHRDEIYSDRKPLPPVMVVTDTIKPGQIDSAPLFQDNLSISSQPEFLGLDRFSSRGQLARRHSLSLHDRIPPPNSIAAEILGKSPSLTFTAGKSIFSNIRDIQESLSDFASANDSVSDASVEPSSSSDDTALKKDQNQGFRTANDKKRSKRYKRKLALTPSKEDFVLKKPNNQTSPQ